MIKIRKYKDVLKLKGGENSHLTAYLTSEVDKDGNPLNKSPYHGDIDLGQRERLPGWTNIGDISSCLRTAVNLGNFYKNSQSPYIAVASKHTRPVIIAKGKTQLEAIIKAIAGDLNSPFGGFFGFNTALTYESAQFLDRMFIEGIVAPQFEQGTAELLKDISKIKSHKNRFLLETGYLTPIQVNGIQSLTPVAMGYGIRQSREPVFNAIKECTIVTGNNGKTNMSSLDAQLLDNIEFAGNAAHYLSSNLVFFVHNGAVAGLGDSCGSRTVAARKARNMLEDSVYTAITRDANEEWDRILYDTPFTKEDFNGISKPIRLIAFSDAFYPKLDGFVETAGIDRVEEEFSKRQVRYTEGKQEKIFIPKKNNFDPDYNQELIPAVIVQPGGSLGDKVILPIVEEHNIKMVFTMNNETYLQYLEKGPGKGVTGRRFFGHDIKT